MGRGARRAGVSWLGLFYAGNLAGAVFGCLLAGFYLLRVYDMAVATYVAVAMNARVAGGAWHGCARGAAGAATMDAGSRTPARPPRRCESGSAAGQRSQPPSRLPRHRPVRLLRARRRSGLDAHAQPDLQRDGLHLLDHSRRVSDRPRSRQQRRRRWSRRRVEQPRLALGWCQLGDRRVRSPGRRYALSASLPFWPHRRAPAREHLDRLPDRLRARPAWRSCRRPLFWGASFPLALAAAPRRRSATPAKWSAASTPPTRSARLPARSSPASCWSRWIGSQHTQQVMDAWRLPPRC